MSRRSVASPIRSAVALGAALACLAAAGCSGDDPPPCFPVAGRVTFRGKPLAEAMVTLHPLDDNVGQAADDAQRHLPLAYSAADGSFQITTSEPGDGAPAGKYAVTVLLRQEVMTGEETVRSGRNLLPEKFARPDTSGLFYEVVPGQNLPLDLNLL